MDTNQYQTSEHSRVRTHADRASYDRELIDSILDGAPYCHVGLVSEGRPIVIPMLHAREGNRLLLHGSPGSRMLNEMVALPLVCVVATILDGLFVGSAVVSHGFNYRSVVVFGPAATIEDPAGKWAALRALTEKAAPGRWDQLAGLPKPRWQPPGWSRSRSWRHRPRSAPGGRAGPARGIRRYGPGSSPTP